MQVRRNTGKVVRVEQFLIFPAEDPPHLMWIFAAVIQRAL